MNLVYFDESGNTGLNLKDRQQPIFLLASIVIKESLWFSLEKSFYDILSSYFGDTANSIELHAIDLRSRKHQFKKISFEETLELRDKMLQLLIDNKVPVFYRSIIKSKFEAFCEKEYGPGIKINPYIMALPFVCMEVSQFLSKQGPSELGMLIFDEQKESFNEVELSLKTLRLDPDSILKTTNIVEKGFFVDSKKSFALQLADIFALYSRKYEEHKAGIRVNNYDQQTFDKIELLTTKRDGLNIKDILEWVKGHHIR